jgi:hypothetical protein
MSDSDSSKEDASESPDASEPSPDRSLSQPLGSIVEQEARRALSEAQLQADPDRIAAGWERRFIADPQRAQEAIELYTEMGFEVCADPVKPDELGEECEDCQLLAQLRFRTIYTRRRKKEGA